MKHSQKVFVTALLVIVMLIGNVNISEAAQTTGFWRLSEIRVLTQDYYRDSTSSYSMDVEYLRRANDKITYKEVEFDGYITLIAPDENRTKTVFQAEFGFCHPPMTLVPGQKVEMYTKARVINNNVKLSYGLAMRCQHWIVDPNDTDFVSGGFSDSVVEVSTGTKLMEEKLKEFTFTPRSYSGDDSKVYVVRMTSSYETAYLKYDYIYKWVDEPISYEQEIRVVINGDLMVSDMPVMIVNSRSFLPLRSLLEALDADVAWDGSTRTITVSKGDTVMKLQIDSNEAILNGQKEIIEVAPIIVNSRTMIPVRYLAESFNFDVGWDEEERIVSIFDKE